MMMSWSDLFPAFQALPLDWKQMPVLVGVSGGADSLALALAYQAFREAITAEAPWCAVTVDHRLRPESTQEAQQVARWLKIWRVPHTTLTWNHAPLSSQIEEKARQARYSLLTGFARDHGFTAVLTAHHALDQIETVLMRAARGSGLTGLRGMVPVSKQKDILIVRPFLTLFPADLRRVLSEAQQPFVEDPSNASSRFERVRWRKGLTFFESRGLNLKGFSHSIQNLQDIEEQLTAAARVFINAQVQSTAGEVGRSFPLSLFRELLPAVGERVLRALLQEVSQKMTPCSQRILKTLRDKLLSPLFKGATAHGCILRRTHGKRVLIFPEKRNN